MVDRQENCWNSRLYRMAEKVTFWPYWKPFNSFWFEILSLFPFISLFSFCYAKKWEGHSSPPTTPNQPSSVARFEFDQVILLREELIIDLIVLLRTCAAYHHLSSHLSEACDFVKLQNVNYQLSILHLLTSGIRTLRLLVIFLWLCEGKNQLHPQP